MRASTPVGEHSPVDAFILIVLSVALVLGSAAFIVTIDRGVASLPRPGDATATTAFTVTDWPSDGQTAITVAVANPSSGPVLVGLSLRRVLLPGGRPRMRVPYRTTRARYQPSRQAAVAAVREATISGLSVPVPSGRRYRLVIMIGQSDGRLCVLSAPFRIARPGGATAGSTRPALRLR
jgi:hypothetical protein